LIFAQEVAVEYSDFVITFQLPAEGGYPVSVSSPAGQGRGLFRLPFEGANLEGLLQGVALEVRSGGARHLVPAVEVSAERLDPLRVGEELFAALFSGAVRDLYHKSEGIAQMQGQTLRIRLEIDPESLLARLPWELMQPPELGGTAGFRRLGSIVRFLSVELPSEQRPLEGPFRVLAVASCPPGLPTLDLARERQQLEESSLAVEGIELRFLERATPDVLRDALLDWQPHALHYMGHGDFDPQTGEGVLVLEGPAGIASPLRGKALAALLQGSHPPALVVLNACDTARPAPRSGLDPFAGVAMALLQGGLLAVVAMQFPISDSAALAFSRRLYGRLAKGDPVEAAVTEGRLAIYQENNASLEWATPVLFSRVAKILETSVHVPTRIAEHIDEFDLYIQEKTRGFVGRQFVFDAVQKFIEEKSRGYFIVRGDPGIGKTALMAEMARTKKHVRHFNIRLRNVTRSDQFLRNVCAQVIAKFRLDHSFLPPDADRSSAFLLSVLAKARSLAGGRKIVVLIDALDEADTAGLSPGANLLCLPESLPEGIYFVATARSLEEDRLPLRIDCETESLFLAHDSVANLADVAVFLRSQLAVPGIQRYLEAQRLAAEDFVHELVDKSEGNFMYLRCVLWEMEESPSWNRSLDQLPKGLRAYYEDHWRRMRAEDERQWIAAKIPVLMALTVTREPIPIELIAKFAQVDDRRMIRSVLREWKPFLHEEGETITERRFRLYHASFFEFLKKKDEVADEHVSFQEAHRRILEAMLDLDEGSPLPASAF
jgi:hypothetical protein